MDDLTEDAVLGGRLRLIQKRRGHRAGSDAVLLAAATRAKAGERIADFGAGVGTAGFGVLLRVAESRAALVEIDPPSADLARRNAALNGLDDRAEIVEGDVLAFARAGPAFDWVIANPPFHPPGGRVSPDPDVARARMAQKGMLENWLRAAARVLRPGGGLALIHRPDALAELLAALDGRFGAVELLSVHPSADRPAVRLIVRAVKGSRAPLQILPPLVMMDATGRFTPRAEAIHRDLAPL